MADNKDKRKAEETTKKVNLEDLDKVTGGSLKDVSKKSTSSISSNTKSKL